MAIYLEHANITVPDIDQAIAFLQVIEPSFYVRQDKSPPNSHRWVHLGNEQVYIALQQPEPGSKPKMPYRTYENFGINHLAWVVDDFDAVVQRLDQNGYKQGLLVKPHRFRKRAYYYDAVGFEWEIIQYISDNNHERNIYEDQ